MYWGENKCLKKKGNQSEKD